ncbi:MAG TPA: SDR family oxidoreductase [Anaerolineales bacterium]|nr:SDR family oxidoreductase [Anaerolineales bacterium]
MDYKDKSVLITGGTSGIGLELARILAARGARLFLFARSQDNLNKTINDLQTVQAGEYHGIPTDVSDANQVAKSVKQVIETAGVPDLLVNCAGAAHPGYVQDLDLEIFRWMMDVNYYGAVYVTKAILPGMIERKSGYIVNIASLAAVVGMYSYTAYGASKFALRGFSDALRMEMKPHGIQVSIVYPADVDTPQLTYENQYKPAELKQILKILPALDPIPPEQVARAIVGGIDRRKNVIIPDLGTSLLIKFSNILGIGNGIYPILDWLLARAQGQIQSQDGSDKEN